MSYKVTKSLCHCYKVDNHIFYIPQRVQIAHILPNWNVKNLSFSEDKNDVVVNNTPKHTDFDIKPIMKPISISPTIISQIELEDHLIHPPKDSSITEGFLTKLFNKKMNVDWIPFICKLEKILYSSKINRYVFICNDGKKSFRVYPATQLYPYIKKDENGEAKIKKGDTIYVKHYSATKLEDSKPKIVIFTDIKKVI